MQTTCKKSNNYVLYVQQEIFLMRTLVTGIVLIVLATAGLTAMASPDNGTLNGDKPVIAVSILPQHFFVERIGGDDVEILVLVGPGQNPHSYEPTPRQLEKLSRAAVWILSGTDFEEALLAKVRSQFMALPVVDGTRGVTFRHLNDHHGDHEHNVDTHSWLGRTPAKAMARNVLEALSRVNPDNSAMYETRYSALVSEIDSVFDDLVERLSPLKGTTVLVYHPAFGYFLDEFDLHQEAVETGGREPTVRTLAALVEKARKERAKAVFVQEQFSQDSANRIADELGVPVVPLDPLSGEWLENIRRMGHALESALINNP